MVCGDSTGVGATPADAEVEAVGFDVPDVAVSQAEALPGVQVEAAPVDVVAEAEAEAAVVSLASGVRERVLDQLTAVRWAVVVFATPGLGRSRRLDRSGGQGGRFGLV